jgi:Putative transposase/Transposase zinc-binding domain
METINDIFRVHAPEYLSRFGDAMPAEHRKAIAAIISCRTEACGTTYFRCESCGEQHQVHRSCGNRHCPTCQHHKARQWLDKNLNRRLPGHHFMITFTVPEELRRFIRSNQRAAYAALFSASSAAMKKLVLDPKFMGGDLPGFFGVLHTWGRTLEYHPHIHYIVVGGAFSSEDRRWKPSGTGFYVPVEALSPIFKAKFKDEMKTAGLLDQVPHEAWEVAWNVNSQAVGDSEASLKYLAPYVFRVALSNNRIVKVEGRTVFIRYKKTGSNRWRTLELEIMEFMRRFLQHVLPTGFMKIRYYGFLSPTCKVPLDHIRALIELSYGFELTPAETEEAPVIRPSCSKCGGALRVLYVSLPHERLARAG